MMKTTLLLYLLVFTTTATLADQTSHRAAAQAVLDVTHAQEVIPQALHQLKAGYAHMIKDLPLKSSDRELEDAHRKRAFSYAEEQINWHQIAPEFITLYMQTYTEAELNEIAAFYRTETGKKYLKNMPATLRQTNRIVHAKMQLVNQSFSIIVNELSQSTGNSAPQPHRH